MMQLSMGDWCMARKKKHKNICPDCGCGLPERDLIGCWGCGYVLDRRLIKLADENNKQREKEKQK